VLEKSALGKTRAFTPKFMTILNTINTGVCGIFGHSFLLLSLVYGSECARVSCDPSSVVKSRRMQVAAFDSRFRSSRLLVTQFMHRHKMRSRLFCRFHAFVYCLGASFAAVKLDGRQVIPNVKHISCS